MALLNGPPQNLDWTQNHPNMTQNHPFCLMSLLGLGPGQGVPNDPKQVIFGPNPKRDIKQKGGFDPLRDMSQSGHFGSYLDPILRETLNKRVVLTPSGTCPKVVILGHIWTQS
jgi:hypothetical protein